AVRLNGVTVAYGKKKVVENISWTVGRGDKWALTGPNGSGKTMLLSLIFADNPQAYANDIILFDRRRGTGESIWDIKDMIGFASPETQLFFRKGKTCKEVALSGLYENPYRPAQATDGVLRFIDESLDYFSMSHLGGQPFENLSTARRNIVLLIRALAKNPPMLVLDEPFQGFDLATVEAARRLLDACCIDRTLIFVSHRPEEFPSRIDKFYAL
ncbi:MAG: ATP-binding cassette domain-containing protein, partial [Prevotellaceae bacterium]|nr:ATP-binding cassette domain-containing protein [Prevotellaceae bacterium]